MALMGRRINIFLFMVPSSDESEPSWLEPQLELKDFWLGSLPFSLQLEFGNRPKTSRNFDFVCLFVYSCLCS